MVQINFASREVNCKIVYYGPGRCGKTTNLQMVHSKAPANSTGDLVSIATEADRTLYFDFLPLDLGTVAGMRTKFQLYTVPGQVYYDATRKLVLQGCDGVVFVADSNPELMAENIESLENLAKNLSDNGLDINDLPVILQWNKRDLPNAVSIAELNAKLNRNGWPTVEAIAVQGQGVFQTLKAISQQVLKRLNRDQGYSDDGAQRGAAGRATPLPVAAAVAASPLPAATPVPVPMPKSLAAPPPPKPAPLPAPVNAAATAGGRGAGGSGLMRKSGSTTSVRLKSKTLVFKERMAELRRQKLERLGAESGEHAALTEPGPPQTAAVRVKAPVPVKARKRQPGRQPVLLWALACAGILALAVVVVYYLASGKG